MKTDSQQPPKCPVGEPECPWLDELQALHGRVTQLEELVSRDPLTGLYNMRHPQETLPVVLERTRRNHKPACLMMVDLDHFKRVNDTWGHEVGNIALKQTARILRSQVRIVDIVCRYGGEEFVIILPDTGLRQAVQIAERIRRTIEETPVRHEEGEFHMSASMGVDVYMPLDERSPDAFLDSADKMLYQAKEGGRNRVVHRDFSDIETETGVSAEEKDALQGLFGKD